LKALGGFCIGEFIAEFVAEFAKRLTLEAMRQKKKFAEIFPAFPGPRIEPDSKTIWGRE